MSSPAAGAPQSQSTDVRTLVLLRHGKSAYPPGVSDHDRPLAPRGRREAALAGKWITRNAPTPDYIMCSSAARTRQTLEATGLATPTVLVDFTSSIYEAYPEELLELVTAAPLADRTVLLVGHAPGVPGLAEMLAGPGSDTDALRNLESKFPTSALAVLTVQGRWADFGAGAATLVDFVVPRA
jgi:phosphohistidine phosphatase